MRFDAKKMGLAALALIVTAPSVPAQTPTKVAIINIQGAILATKDGEKARNAIRVKFEPRAKEMEGRNAEIQKMKDQYGKGANTMSAEARDKLQRDIEDKQKKLQWDSEDMQNELQQEEGKLVNEIGQRMIQVIDEYAKGQNFAIVLDVSTQQSPVLWAANGIEITQPLVDLYDKKFGAGAAPAAAAPGAPAAKSAAPPAAAAPGAPGAPAAKPAAPPAAAPKKPAGVK
ncbi:MAG: OmpH family outer membrane protein [Candidatus Solibacter usitatus]|nr:OmpH family outer membrane protein [Candidatus Solibacter usitatus]